MISLPKIRRKCLCANGLRQVLTQVVCQKEKSYLAWKYILDFFIFPIEVVDKYCIMKAQEKTRKEKDKKMKNTKIIMNREELNEVLYNNSIELDTLVGTEYAIGGELLDEAKNNRNMIEYFFPMGDEGEFIEVDNDGYVINDGIYR